LKITIGLFCFGSFSLGSLLSYIEETYKIKPSDIKRLRVASKFEVHTENGITQIPMREIEKHILPSCRTCTDFASELADISVGSAYPLPDWSTVIIRTKAGEDFFYDAVANGVINTWVIEQEPKVYERIVMAAMQKRKAALKEADEMEAVYGYLPVLMLRETDALAKIKVADIMAKDITTVPKDMTVRQFLDYVAIHHHISYPMMNENGEPVGWATLEEASSVPKSKRETTLISQISRRKPVIVYADETALDAFKRMSENETGRVLIFDRANPQKLLGIVTKTDLMHTLTKQC
jgi:CBS domain-containing protein